MRRPFLNDEEAIAQIESSNAVWYQRFHLSNNVVTPGVHDIEAMLDTLGVPEDLSGMHILDIGTANGGAAFTAERRGAERVVAIDIMDPHHHAFTELADALGSSVEFHRASVYELPSVLNETFDIVFFLGVLYHLRHPLLAVDSLRSVTRGRVYVDTAVSPEEGVLAEFYLREYDQDVSNWFVPSVRCVIDWFESCGFTTELISAWPEIAPRRAAFLGQVSGGEPYWRTHTYEQPLKVLTLANLPSSTF